MTTSIPQVLSTLMLLPVLLITLFLLPIISSSPIAPSDQGVNSVAHPVIKNLDEEFQNKVSRIGLDEVTTPAQVNETIIKDEKKNGGLVVHHSPRHTIMPSKDWSMFSNDGFYLRLMVVISLAVVVAMILLLLSNYGPKKRFKGYQITSLNDKDFYALEDDDDDELLFDAGNHKLLSKSRMSV
jgi:hypothetical protein